MKIFILACKSLEAELEAAKKNTGCKHDTLYFDSGLHVCPDSLRAEIAKHIAELKDVSTLYLVMGLCGKAVEGLYTPFCLIIPKVDDCITMLLTINGNPCMNLKKSGHMYYTKGMAEILENGADLGCTNFNYSMLVEKYGKDDADGIMRDIYSSYVSFDIIDDGIVPVNEIYTKAKAKADIVGCPVTTVPGSNLILEKMCRNEIDDQFLVFDAGTTVSIDDFVVL